MIIKPVSIYLHEKAANAITDLQARKELLQDALMVKSCHQVPAGEGKGTSGILAALREIDETIVKLIARSLLERRDIA